MKVIIIGGVAGGATAAARLRRLDEKAEIILLERSGYVSYANCGLPYYVGGVISQKEALTLQTPESFRKRFRIDVRIRNEAVSIDPKGKTVRIRRLEDGTEYEETYDKLILSPGARPIIPPLPGIEDPRIMTLRTVEDTFRIREYLDQNHPRRAVVVGGGFIGLEAAENLMKAGIDVTLVEQSSQVLPPMDYDMACQVHAYLRQKGLKLRLNASAAGFEAEGEGLKLSVEGEKPEKIEADFVLLAIGVVPETGLAKEAGLLLGTKGAIVVNERMETSEPDIYAVGDAVEIRHFVTGQKALIALAGPANKQGRIAADNICGRNSVFSGSQGSSILKLFDMTAASTGLNERMARDAGLDYDKVVTYSASHATYYPGATDMTVKTIYERGTGKILGAQVVGFEGVDKRIDVMAASIRANGTAEELAELELAYAPPFSSAKDPVNMAGYVIENVRAGLVRQYHWPDVEKLSGREDVLLLDVRTRAEYGRGHLPNAVNLPLDELREHLGELDRTKIIYVNCHSGLRSYLACRILSQEGFDCLHLSGGFRFYDYVKQDRLYDETPEHPCGLPIV